MVKINQEFVVIDNSTRSDITAATMTQIIFDTERKTNLRDMIQTRNGSLSNYLAMLGAFPEDHLSKTLQAEKETVVSERLCPVYFWAILIL